MFFLDHLHFGSFITFFGRSANFNVLLDFKANKISYTIHIHPNTEHTVNYKQNCLQFIPLASKVMTKGQQ